MARTSRRIAVATAIIMLIPTGASVAHAEDNVAPTTTVAQKSKKELRKEYQAALKAYNAAKKKAQTEFQKAVKTANQARRAALKGAGKKKTAAITKTYNAAVKQAKVARDAAIFALGQPPVKPQGI